MLLMSAQSPQLEPALCRLALLLEQSSAPNTQSLPKPLLIWLAPQRQHLRTTTAPNRSDAFASVTKTPISNP